jgi:hypothetical protein
MFTKQVLYCLSQTSTPRRAFVIEEPASAKALRLIIVWQVQELAKKASMPGVEMSKMETESR